MSVEIKFISKSYGNRKALDNISFSFGKGELVGFLGPNGAGKSTLMKIITGYLKPDSGEIFVHGINMREKGIDGKNIIGYLPENNPLYADLYVKESLAFTAGIYKIRNSKKRIEEIIEITGLGIEKHKKIGALSKGYRQRVGLAQALIHDPPVLILDEPTTGLDPNQIEEIRKLIQEISKEKSVMLSSHIMQEVEAICNRALVIKNGKIIADGKVDELKKDSLESGKILIAEINGDVSENQFLEIQGIRRAIKENNKWLIEVNPDKDVRADIFEFAVKNNLIILSLQESNQSLEKVFQNLTR